MEQSRFSLFGDRDSRFVPRGTNESIHFLSLCQTNAMKPWQCFPICPLKYSAVTASAWDNRCLTCAILILSTEKGIIP